MSLYPRLILGNLDLMDAPFMVLWGRDHGAPENVYETVVSSLSDGEEISSTRTGNREFSIPIGIDGVDLTELAELEAMLVAECEKPRNVLSIDPGDGAPVAVFDTFRAQLRMVFSDAGEIGLLRRYDLTIQALPHCRGEDAVVTPALETGAATVVSIDTGDSTTGWVSPNGPVNVASGGVGGFADHGEVALTRTGSVAFGTTPYLIVDWHTPAGFQANYPPALTVRVNGGPPISATAEAAVLVGSIQARRSYFRVSGTATTLAFEASSIYQVFGPYFLRIFDLSRTAASPALSTRRQLFRTIDVGGSAPTYGSIDVTHASSLLGDTLIYTYPAELGYQPPLSPFLASPALGARVADAAAMSGGYHSISTTSYWLVPASAVPEGEYLLVARVRNQGATADVKIEWQSRSYMNGTAVHPAQNAFGSVVVNMPTGVWQTVTLDAINLPHSRVGPDGMLQILIGTVTPSIIIDELWIFNTKGDLTVVNGVGTTRLRIVAPSLDEPHGAIWVANEDDFSDAYSASPLCTARAHHRLKPGPNNVYTVTQIATDAAVSSTHYNRSHTHPAA